MLRRSRRALLALATGLAIIVPAVPASAADGHLTDEDPYITLTGGGRVLPIITVGEKLDGFLFEGIPDGIGITRTPGDRETVDVYVAHEQSEVPFPPLSGDLGPPLADFEDASVSKLTLDTYSGRVLAASVAIPPAAGFLRFCSAFLAGRAEGFRQPIFFANEEANDVVDVPRRAPYGPDPSLAPNRQAGYAVALNTRTGEYDEIRGLGRFNHENTIVVPGGWDRTAVLSTDDTFDGPSAQLYLYLARNGEGVVNDEGHLWAFRVTRKNGSKVDAADPFNDANDYLDIRPGDTLGGRFIRVPDRIADGRTALAPQEALENWSNRHNVFQFIRLEDLATDRHRPRVVYIADTGRDRVVPDGGTGRLVRGPSGTVGEADFGTIFKMVMSKRSPRAVKKLVVLAQGDDAGLGRYVNMRAPDNVDTSRRSLMVQEDASDAKIWRLDLGSGSWEVVATVNDSGGESSGIVDASRWFGPGTWLLTVQAHSTYQKSKVVPNPTGSGPDLTVKREDGQLLLLTIPGS